MSVYARRKFLQFLAASPLYSLASGQSPSAPAASPVLATAPDPGAKSALRLIASPDLALSVFDFEAVARNNMPPAHFGYIATGVDDDRTLHANHEAFNHLQLRPRRLVDVSHIDTSVELFGVTWPQPLFLCPCGSQHAFHPEGELATARAGKTRKTLQVLSTVATESVENVMQEAWTPIWQQLYPTTSWKITEAIVRRAEKAGCPVLVITIDLPAGRNTETLSRFSATDTRKCTACHVSQNGEAHGFSPRKPSFDGLDTSQAHMDNPAFTWDSVRQVRAMTSMKIVIKGLQTAEDAKLAVEHGIDGIIVSNHGGRAEETGRATIECLPEVIDAVRRTNASPMPVMLDGGIRRGTDIFKALALGASAVGIGRPYLWGLGAFGQPGVERVLDILHREFSLSMQQCGVRSLREITPAYVVRPSA
jgi:isopentenyl diphosphate isomerase/L-lactate dehydrogenase-like FMN-dependent dehydrogenase